MTEKENPAEQTKKKKALPADHARSQGPLGSADSSQLKRPLQTQTDSCYDCVVQKHQGFKPLVSAFLAPRMVLKEILGILSKY